MSRGDARTEEASDTPTGGGEGGTHEVEIVHGDHRTTVAVGVDESVLEAAEAAGLDLPFSCRQGQCTSCVGRVIEGKLDQSRGTALDPMQRDEGFALLCVARPESSCRVEADVQAELFGDLDVL